MPSDDKMTMVHHNFFSCSSGLPSGGKTTMKNQNFLPAMQVQIFRRK